MVNWSGTLTNSTPSGTSTGGNLLYTFKDTTATWTVNALSNWMIRITGGTGSGQTKYIVSNTATQIILTSLWDTIPDATSTYELVVQLRNGDHITAALTLSTGVITELENSATIYFDGKYSITFNNTCKIRWGKSKTTIVTFQPNNISVTGKSGSYGGFIFALTLTNPVAFSYLYILDATQAITAHVSTGLGDYTGIHHLRFRNLQGDFWGYPSGTPTQNISVKYLLNECPQTLSNLNYNQIANTPITEEFSNIWVEYGYVSPVVFGTTNTSLIQILRNSVFRGSFGSTAAGPRTDANKQRYITDSYLSSTDYTIIVARGSTVSDVGRILFSRNVTWLGREVYNASASTMAINSSFNDYTFSRNSSVYRAIECTNSAEITSDSDFMSGHNLADLLNVDTTQLTSSNSVPPQYSGLTAARTRAKSTKNFLLSLDNVVVGTPTSTGVTILFDCANSHAGTTVNVTSNAEQTTLNVADTSDFQVNGIVEIAYGTVRQEFGEIASINAGVSLVLKSNLLYTHTAGQADTVKKQLRNLGLPFIKYGYSSGNYLNSTPVPPREKWGAIFVDFETNFNGVEFAWKKYGHSIDLSDLEPGTTYYATIYAYTPLGDLMSSSEITFTTAPQTAFTDPTPANVRSGISYVFNNVTQTGVLNLPAIGDVRFGITYDNSTKTGILNLPIIGDVRIGVTYDNATKTGVLNIPVIGDVRFGITYDNDTKIGVLDLPSIYNVLAGILFDNGTKTGAFAVPSIEDTYDYFTASGRNLDTSVSTRASQSSVDTIKEDTETIISTLSTLIADIWEYTTRTLTAGTRDSEIDDIKDKVDNLPDDPASESGVLAKEDQATLNKQAIIDEVDANEVKIDAVKADTESIITTLSTIVSDIWSYTTRELTSFNSLVSDIVTAVWSNVTRTLTAGTRDSEIDDIKDKVDAMPDDITSETNATSNKNEIIDSLDNHEELLKRILGLSQENYRIISPTYDSNGNLLTSILRIYPTATDCNNDTNKTAEYHVDATYDSQGIMTAYKVTKV